MKRRTLVSILIPILICILLIGGCATDKKMDYISKEYEIYGTWVNPDHRNVHALPKIVIHPTGEAEFYHTVSNTNWEDVEFVITNKWTDSKGNIWYTIITKHKVKMNYMLAKISNSGKILEWSFSTTDYPKEIDQTDVHSVYEIYYRQE